jgi:hypothetical protein
MPNLVFPFAVSNISNRTYNAIILSVVFYGYVPLIPHFKGRTQSEDIQHEGAEFGAKLDEATGG